MLLLGTIGIEYWGLWLGMCRAGVARAMGWAGVITQRVGDEVSPFRHGRSERAGHREPGEG